MHKRQENIGRDKGPKNYLAGKVPTQDPVLAIFPQSPYLLGKSPWHISHEFGSWEPILPGLGSWGWTTPEAESWDKDSPGKFFVLVRVF